MASLSNDVVIIGAGLGGAALALALHQKSIPCRIYESRTEDAKGLGSGVTLTPNGLRVLDRLGVYERIAPLGYQSESFALRNAEGHTIRNVHLAAEQLYGYKTCRVYRQLLLDELRALLKERNIPVEYGAKFEEVQEETTDGVTFRINGRTERASLLIGVDGIHSAVRKYLTLDLPAYTGVACVYGHVPTDSISWLKGEPDKGCTIQDEPGALFMIPEDTAGSDLMVGRQFSYPSLDRVGWEALGADKDALCGLLCKGYNKWHDPAKELLDQLSTRKEGLQLWPFQRMPKMERWSSPTGRVIITGDAAHAMPPSSGQGVNQAFEDGYTLALLLSFLSPKMKWIEALDHWHHLRQVRIDAILDMAYETDIMRLSKDEREVFEQKWGLNGDRKLQPREDYLKWLFAPGTEDDITAWMSAHS
ncbi:hypothetical protein DTO166G4_2381 [Paecilomyces variotii]|nr:hypothetical protein DTO166G4_2381 [Paecilomyces variotii]KAJ9240666.1 hypothetical protein DTO166G5_1475 [Paecilomyces variotii]KAJ9291676.1 hypothetical protein DTO021C3_577 [Paecilomyces variotii]KAJ9305029.1 hypothetical protein DTO217A2_5521 [Paecilomyces variotii]KAJ9328561.1 hypothetical protein DTO027B3_827 [Paecilomyces variotii]